MALARCALAAAALLAAPALGARKIHVDGAVGHLAVAGKDKDVDCDDHQLKIKGKSGKFEFYNKKKGEGKSGIEIELDALRELDAAGNVLGAAGATKHSLDTFANQDFTIEEAADGLIDGLNTRGVHFESTIPDVGTVVVETYIIKNEGEAGSPGEKWKVHPGDLKFNIGLGAWNWCEAAKKNCKNKGDADADGAFVELDIKVRRKSGKGMKVRKHKEVLQEGEDAEEKETLELATRVEVDGVWQDMPAGYPKITQKGKTATFTFRFPKFTDKVLYDPLISESGDTKSGAPRAAALGLLPALLAGLLLRA